MGRLPVVGVVTDAATIRATDPDRDLIAWVISRAPTARMLSGFGEALGSRVDDVAVADLLRRVAEERRSPLGRPQPRGRRERPWPSTTWSLGSVLRDRLDFVKLIFGSARAALRHWRGTESRGYELQEMEDPVRVQRAAPEAQGAKPSGWHGAAAAEALRKAYPRIEIDAGFSRPDVVVIDTPFRVTVGLGRYKDDKLTQSGGMTFAAVAATEVGIVLVYDPNSLATTDATRFTLTVTDANPYPRATLTFTAAHLEDMRSDRRIGIHFLRDRQIVGIAWKSFAAVTTPAEVAAVEFPETRESALLDLDPLLDAEQPDLVLSICGSDGPATGEFVWTAFAGASRVTVPDGPRISPIGTDLAGFVEDVRKTVQLSQGPYPDFRALTGKAIKLGRAIPEGINRVLHDVIEDPSRRTAPMVLLLTEELNLPWELLGARAPVAVRLGWKRRSWLGRRDLPVAVDTAQATPNPQGERHRPPGRRSYGQVRRRRRVGQLGRRLARSRRHRGHVHAAGGHSPSVVQRRGRPVRRHATGGLAARRVARPV